MERMNDEIRDREKTMRGLKKVDTPILTGYQIYHNYFREHEGLNGINTSRSKRDKDRRSEQVDNGNSERNQKYLIIPIMVQAVNTHMKQRLKYGACGASGVRGEHAPMRRSVTIVEENNQKLQKARGMLLMSGSELLDMDYTSALNLFLRMGLKKFFKESFDQDDLEYIVGNYNAKMEITQDEMEEMKNKISSLTEKIKLEEYRKEREQREKAEAESVAK